MSIIDRIRLALLAATAAPALAFDPPTDAGGPLKATIEPVPGIRAMDRPAPVRIRIENRSDAPVRGEVTLRVVDRWRIEGPARQPFEAAPRGTARVAFRIAAGPGTLPELYPIHAFVRFRDGGTERVLHPVLIFRPNVPWPGFPARAGAHPAEPAAIPITPDSRLPLVDPAMARVRFRVFGGDEVAEAPGWEGGDAMTGTHFAGRQRVERGGKAAAAITMHPPWRTGPGTIYADFRLRLPAEGPIRLRFATAIRDHHPPEPPSDGVTFRVWARGIRQKTPARLFERASDAKVWQPGEVDLSPYAGREILLTLECHPGPKRDTTCDQAYWGDPVVVAGEPAPPSPVRAAEAERLLRFDTEEGPLELWCARGRHGLLDATLSFRAGGGEGSGPARPRGGAETRGKPRVGSEVLSFRGFEARVRLAAGRRWNSDAGTGPVSWARTEGGIRVTHPIPGAGPDQALVAEISAEAGGVWIAWRSGARIEHLAPGPFAARARRIFAGPGNVIVDPRAFTLGYDGHRLSARHVGLDFEDGWSLLEATDPPPDRFRVAPEQGVYALEVHPAARFFLAPGRGGALRLVGRWRAACGLRPAGGVAALAGRFVFDLWGGRYGPSADALALSARYGLTHSLVVWHNWQRWGYDYRLPDIFPPNPALGTLEAFRRLADTCRARGILFAPHDNYIDIYPDAEGFTFDRVCFREDGRPVRAWFNRGRGAQSFRFRPDRFGPFLRKNVEALARTVRPTAYFIDVFSSIGLFDYHDREGGFHGRTETQRLWGEAFAWIRERLGGAPQISESGHDGLIGWLDGAQTNHLRVDASQASWTTWKIRCADAERVPWFDLAYHDRFVLHGAGYSSRYQGGLPAIEHGIHSDDYIATEVLTGHPGMVPRPFGALEVRKYWLTHDLMEAVALVPLADIAFSDGDIHRQTVAYEGGAVVRVNRGASDWTVGEHVLPPYGFWGRAPAREGGGRIEAAIERIDGVIVEWARGPAACYANARPVDPHGRTPVRPRAAALRPRGGRAFEIRIIWSVERGPLDGDYGAFVHFLDGDGGIAFQADHTLPVPTSAWKRGTERSGARFEVPASAKPGRYPIAVGLWSPGRGRRLPLLGRDLGGSRILAGTLILARDGGGALSARLEPPPEEDPPRWNVAGEAIDLGWVRTDGAFRILPGRGSGASGAARDAAGRNPDPAADGAILRILPLPGSLAFSIDLRLDRLPWRVREPHRAEAFDLEGKRLGGAPVEVEKGSLRLPVPAGIFEVRLR